jgi:hypothetical protein
MRVMWGQARRARWCHRLQLPLELLLRRQHHIRHLLLLDPPHEVRREHQHHTRLRLLLHIRHLPQLVLLLR